MEKRLLADVLWDAANEHLQSDDGTLRGDRWGGSCCAVARALRLNWPDGMTELAKNHPVFAFLADLGGSINTAYLSLQPNPQSCRYIWLLLAMHVAEDEGVTL